MNFIGAFFIGDIEIAQHSITSIPTKKTAKNKLEDTNSFTGEELKAISGHSIQTAPPKCFYNS